MNEVDARSCRVTMSDDLSGEILMDALKSMRTKAGTAGELLHFFLKNKWWWLAPMLTLLLLLAVLILLAQSSAIAPFIYTLF